MAGRDVRYSGSLDTSINIAVPIVGQVQFHKMDTVMRAYGAGTASNRLWKRPTIGPEVDLEADQGVTQGDQEMCPSTRGSDKHHTIQRPIIPQ